MMETARDGHRTCGRHCRYENDRKWILIAVFALAYSPLCLAATVIILSRRISELQALINQ